MFKSSKVKWKKLEMKGVGEILLERSCRAKRLSVSIRPFKGVRIAVPHGVSFERAWEFACLKSGWIKKHVKNMERFEQEASELKKDHHIDRREARKRLVKRIEVLSNMHGYKYNRVFIRNQKTLWGSCTRDNNINLNVNLVGLPAELVDYTILHELVHTRIKNHSKNFWDELDRLVGDAKKIDRQLRLYMGILA